MSTPTSPKPLIVRLVEMLKEWGTLKADFDAKENDEASITIAACHENLREVVNSYRADVHAAQQQLNGVCPLRQQLERIGNKVADWHERDITEVSTEELLQVIEDNVKPKESAVQRLYLNAARDVQLLEDRLEATGHHLRSVIEDLQVGKILETKALLNKLVTLASEGMAGKQPDGLSRIYGERVRQLIVEGHTPESDARYLNGELQDAAIAYLMICDDEGAGEEAAWAVWPWEPQWFKPRDAGGGVDVLRCLVKAGALIAAEIDRLSRADGKEAV